jgi:hypothetical protein
MNAHEAVDTRTPALIAMEHEEPATTNPLPRSWNLAAALRLYARETDKAALRILAKKDGRTYEQIAASLVEPVTRQGIGRAVARLARLLDLPTRRPGRSATLSDAAKRGWVKRREKAPAAEATEASSYKTGDVNPEGGAH